MTGLAPVLTPHGVLILRRTDDEAGAELAQAARLEARFDRGTGHGLLSLGADEVGAVLPPVLTYWRDLATRYLTALCALPDIGAGPSKPAVPLPADEELNRMAAAAPPMTGAEYLTPSVLADFWCQMDTALAAELADTELSLQDFLKSRHPAWNMVGRVHFNLAENRQDEELPFAFLATYTTRLSAQATAQHLPLGKALQEYAGAKNRERMLSLLMPVKRAAEHCGWLRQIVDTGEIYHPLRWSPQQALALLRDVPVLESAGVVVRMPAGWRMNRPTRPQVTVTVGGRPPSGLGMDALLDFKMEVTLDGEKLTASEIKRLLAHSDGLALIRGKWVELDRDRLSRTVERFEMIERDAKANGLSFGEAMRLLAGTSLAEERAREADAEWSRTVAGPWLAQTLKNLRGPDGLARINPGRALNGSLRPYQLAGVQWLHLLASLRLGACLADDMGLGKTIQVLSLLLVLKAESSGERKPSLVVAPASLLANWAAEIARFAPSMKVIVIHPSAMPAERLKAGPIDDLAAVDLAITSYGFLARLPWLAATPWRLAVVDEAQAIKNPGAKQTRAVKRLCADARIALTGTPIENRLSDLWSIFDFVNPGLLGSAKQFSTFVKRLVDRPHNPYGPLRDLVRPYILRRLKTDKRIIADLPDKTEVTAFCLLSHKQAALYQQAVDEFTRRLETTEGIERKGVVLALLMRLKQICNHPSQWLGDQSWAEEDSGKLARLRELAEEIASRQEKMLLFTQFRETTAPLASFLGSVFGRGGFVLHGETAIGKRKDLVRRFQEDDNIPFFVVSLKAGGVGLNLTAASHVIHFDRWWNPAVENQATDRAFRIGQTSNVLVHKFVCRGTVEEKIDQMVETKQRLAGDFLSSGAELVLTEMNDDELLDLVALDLGAAMKEG
jgi:non-specific serine/threonine protein kinase